MKLVRLGSLVCAAVGAALLTGCVVAPADGVYYGDAYSTYPAYSTGGYGYGYGYSGYPYYGGSSLVIERSPTYVYGGRPYYRPGGGGHYRPNYGGNYNRPSHQGNRPSYVSPGAGSQLGRPSGGNSNSGSYRPSRPSGGGGGGRVPGYQEVKPPQWQR